MKILVALATLILLINQLHAQAQRPQNLCRDALENGSIFAADPSDCSLYLFCDADGVTHVQRCDHPSYPFFWFDRCIETNTHCNPLALLCPPSNQSDVMSAIPTDPTCRDFRPCRLPGMNPPLSCTHPDALFDRNTGTCAPATRAPCFFAQNPVLECEAGVTGFFPMPDSCYEYYFCLNGEFITILQCTPGTFFDAIAQECLEGTCPIRRNKIPKAPNGKMEEVERKRFNLFGFRGGE